MNTLMMIFVIGHSISVTEVWFTTYDKCVMAQPAVRATIEKHTEGSFLGSPLALVEVECVNVVQ